MIYFNMFVLVINIIACIIEFDEKGIKAFYGWQIYVFVGVWLLAANETWKYFYP